MGSAANIAVLTDNAKERVERMAKPMGTSMWLSNQMWDSLEVKTKADSQESQELLGVVAEAARTHLFSRDPRMDTAL